MADRQLSVLSRILVIRGGALGDFILTLPAIKLLRDAFPDARLEILGYKHIVVLAELAGYADATRSIESGALAGFFARDGTLDPELTEYFGSFQQVVSYLVDPDEIFATNLRRAGVEHLLVASPKLAGAERASRQLARPLEQLALYLENPAPLILPNDEKMRVASLIALHPGSGSETKNWPIQRFIELASTLLASDAACTLLLIGGEADVARVAQLLASLPNERIKLAKNLSLPELARELQACGAFLGHDSGVSHLAAAVGVPSLLLFGPTDPAVWAPANPWVQVLRAPTRRMDGIDVHEVCDALNSL